MNIEKKGILNNMNKEFINAYLKKLVIDYNRKLKSFNDLKLYYCRQLEDSKKMNLPQSYNYYSERIKSIDIDINNYTYLRDLVKGGYIK